MNYKVGQVLFMTNPESLKIIPIQVVEEVSRKTLSGTEITYMIQLPDKNKTVADIKDIKGKLFDNIDSLRATMIEKATQSIDKMILLATNLSKKEFNKKENSVEQEQNDVQAETNNDIILVDLGNGVKAKMKTNELEKVSNQ